MNPGDEELERAATRRCWPVRKYELGKEPGDDLSAVVSSTERLAMMWPLALEAWKLAGLPIPGYTRGNIPARIERRRTG